MSAFRARSRRTSAAAASISGRRSIRWRCSAVKNEPTWTGSTASTVKTWCRASLRSSGVKYSGVVTRVERRRLKLTGLGADIVSMRGRVGRRTMASHCSSPDFNGFFPPVHHNRWVSITAHPSHLISSCLHRLKLSFEIPGQQARLIVVRRQRSCARWQLRTSLSRHRY